jgi:acetyltransferase
MISHRGYELIIGSSMDEQFGPVLLFGFGGQMVEFLHDRALGLPPLNTTLARRMMEQTRVFNGIAQRRGGPSVDLAALERILVRFSQLVIEHRWIKEIEINPLLASDRLIALDARVILYSPEFQENQLPKLAIRPYPTSYISSWRMPNGEQITIRPIRPDDEPMMVRLHEALSEQSVYRRYFGTVSLTQRTAHQRLIRMCFIDYDREMALVAVRGDPQTGTTEIIGVGRLVKTYSSARAEVAFLVADRFQGKGLGTELVRQLLRIAPQEGIWEIFAETLSENEPMQRIFRKLGFRVKHNVEDQVTRAEISLYPNDLTHQ